MLKKKSNNLYGSNKNNFFFQKTYFKPMCLYIVRFYTIYIYIYMHIQYDKYRISYDIDNYEKSNKKMNKSYLNKIGFRIENLMWVKKKNS